MRILNLHLFEKKTEVYKNMFELGNCSPKFNIVELLHYLPSGILLRKIYWKIKILYKERKNGQGL